MKGPASYNRAAYNTEDQYRESMNRRAEARIPLPSTRYSKDVPDGEYDVLW